MENLASNLMSKHFSLIFSLKLGMPIPDSSLVTQCAGSCPLAVKAGGAAGAHPLVGVLLELTEYSHLAFREL